MIISPLMTTSLDAQATRALPLPDMSIHRFTGALGSIEVERGVGAVFRATYVSRQGHRVAVAWPPLPEGMALPMYAIVCEHAQASDGNVVTKTTGHLGWKRKADASVAAQAMLAPLGQVAPAAPDDGDEHDYRNGLRIWFSWQQLEVLRKIVEEGSTLVDGADAVVDAVVDRVDCAVRAAASRQRLAKAA